MTGTIAVIGLGLIGGSVALAAKAQGYDVIGVDRDPVRCQHAGQLGAFAATDTDLATAAVADVVVIATPVGAIAAAARAVLDAGASVVTDVGSVKGSVVAAIDDPRFVGGHPMAGSEQEGLSGARADMFTGAVWVLTPTPTTSDTAFARVRSLVASFDCDVVTMDAARHDQVVAVVSHVPHLTAVTLMGLADARSEEHRALLRLAAGGFRDMTRIAAGHAGIWPDICAENRDAIVPVLNELVASLQAVAGEVESADRASLLRRLETSRAARLNLPTGVPRDVPLAELRVTVLDQPGELARITTLATEVDVNIYDLEIAHSSEGARGVVIMVVPQARGERLVGALMAHGYRPALRPLEP